MPEEVVVFSSINPTEVHLVRSVLTREGITSRVLGQFRTGLVGEIPTDAARTELFVPAPLAAEAVALIERALAAADVERTCPACGEANPGAFELCWACGADIPQGPVLVPPL